MAEVEAEHKALFDRMIGIKSSKQYNDAEKKLRDAKAAYRGKQSDNIAWLKAKLGEVREMGSDGLPVLDHLNRSRSPVRKYIETAYSNYPKSWVEESIARGDLTPKKVDRGYYSDWRQEIAISVWGGDTDALETAFHELGHRFEKAVDGIRDAEEAFYKRRTQGESLEWLGGGYGKGEKTRKDQFISPYMGKDYGGKAYELVSMGFEYAYNNPVKLADDPDMQAWIYGILTLL